MQRRSFAYSVGLSRSLPGQHRFRSVPRIDPRRADRRAHPCRSGHREGPVSVCGYRPDYRLVPRIVGYARPFLAADQDKALTILRHTVVGGIQDVPRHAYVVPRIVERDNQFTQKLFMSADRQASVFETKVARVQFGDHANKFQYKCIARIFERPLTDQENPCRVALPKRSPPRAHQSPPPS